MSVSNSAAEAYQALEEKRMRLERDLQAERSAREAEVAALSVKNSELERQVAEHMESKATLAARHKQEQIDVAEDHKSKVNEFHTEIERLTERTSHLAGESTMHSNEASRLREQLQDAEEDTEDLRKRLAEEEARSDQLEKRKHDLLQALNEKDRLLRDHRTESELDRATLEKELAEAKERLDNIERENAAQVASLESDIQRLQAKSSTQESDNAELQTMCDERGRSISTMRAEALATNAKVMTLVGLCQVFYSQCEGFLRHFVREEVPKAPASGNSTTLSRSKAPAANFRPDDNRSFDSASLERAIAYMESRQPSDMWEMARAQCEYCLFETKNWQKQCKRYKERMDKAIATSKDKIAFRSFHANDLALFLPTKNATERVFAAFNFGKPNHFLKPTGRLIDDVENKEWIVARITSISEGVAESTDGIENNPYLLRPGSKYCMLEAEFWPSGSNRRTSRTISGTDKKVTSPSLAEGRQTKKEDNLTGTSPDGAFLTGPADLTSSPPDMAGGRTHNTQPSTSLDTPSREHSTATDEIPREGEPPNTMDFSAFTVVPPSQEAVNTAQAKPLVPSGASSLSSSRPKDLAVPSESPIAALPGQGLDAHRSANVHVGTGEAGDEEPAFLPRPSPETKTSSLTSPQVIPRSSLTASKQHPSAFSRSFGSSNGSGGSSGFRNRLSSSSFLTPSKAPATVASSPGGTSSYVPQRIALSSSASPPQSSGKIVDRTSRYTQTIGRYTGKSSRSQLGDGHGRQVSASGASLPQSSARELLRSFTASSSGGGGSST